MLSPDSHDSGIQFESQYSKPYKSVRLVKTINKATKLQKKAPGPKSCIPIRHKNRSRIVEANTPMGGVEQNVKCAYVSMKNLQNGIEK